MNEILQRHGCSNVFSFPEGLKELMSDITREVLREQPENIYEFIANYLSVLLMTREHGVMAVAILDDLCDCRPSIAEHLIQLGLESEQAETMAYVIKEEIESVEPADDKKGKVKEAQIIKKILARYSLDEDAAAKVCQVARNAYKDYWYRKKILEKHLQMDSSQPWEIAAQRTLEIYKRTKPSLAELTKATERIQAAYHGYHVRRNLLHHLKPKKFSKIRPKANLPGPPIDIAGSREIDLGPMLELEVDKDDVHTMFSEEAAKTLGLQYDPMKTITHINEDEQFSEQKTKVSLPSALSHSVQSKLETYKSKSEMGAEMNIQSPRTSIKEIKIASSTPSAITETRKSRLSSLSREIHKTSFAEEPDVVIPSLEEVGDELKPFDEAESEKNKHSGDTVTEEENIQTPLDVTIIPEPDENENLPPDEAPLADIEAVEEIIEDLPDDQTEADAIVSGATSEPVTADDTDIEGDELVTSGEEEG